MNDAARPPFVIFRCDASPAIGGGHVMRCLTLAEELQSAGWRVAFAVGPQTLSVVPGLRDFSGDVLVLDDNSEPQVLSDKWPAGCDWLVVDHYGLDAAFETACRDWAGRVLVIDDLADRRHDGDLLVDSSLDHGAAAYENLLPTEARHLCGPSYALLRPQFAARRRDSLARRTGKLERVLVSLGASAPRPLIDSVLAALGEALPDAAVDVVSGLAAEVPDPAANANVTWHGGVKDMAALMAAADLSIGAGGTTSWERCCLGLPTILLVLADNQTGNARALEQADAAVIAAAETDAIAAALSGLGSLTGMSRRAAALCDGRGAARVALAMLTPETARDGASVGLRLADLSDGEVMYQWQCHPDTRRFARNSDVPDHQGHLDWMARSISDPDRILCVITYGGVAGGVLRLDRNGDAEKTFEVSILVDPGRYRLGLAGAALSLLARWRPGSRIRAYVKDDNAASQALFTAAGYVPDAKEWYVWEPIVQSEKRS